MSTLTCLADCIFSRNGECNRPTIELDSTLSDFHDPHYVACPHFLPRLASADSGPQT